MWFFKKQRVECDLSEVSEETAPTQATEGIITPQIDVRITPEQATENTAIITKDTEARLKKAYKEITEASKNHQSQIDLWAMDGYTPAVMDVLERDGYKIQERGLTTVRWIVSWKLHPSNYRKGDRL